jgi:hypothetical protein
MNRLSIAILALVPFASPMKAAELPDAASAVIDGPFLAALGVEAAAKSADMWETARINGRQLNCYTFKGGQHFGQTVCSGDVVENDWLFGAHPSTARLIFENAGIFGAEASVCYLIKRSHLRVVRHLWWIPLAYQSQMHIRLAVHNGGLR